MRYFLLQIKKVCKALPFLLITTLVLTGILGLLALAQTREAQADEGRQKIRLGIVGDAEDEFVKNGISLLQEMDSSRFTCTIEQMTETEARQELERQEINGYLIIPDDFVRSVMSGENDKVTFVTGTAQYGLGTMLARELADAVSTLLTETQSGIYAFIRFARQEGATAPLDEQILQMNFRYFDVVLPRADIYNVDTPDSTSFLSVQGYYFCSVLLLFFLFFGTASCYLFIRREDSLGRMLAVQGRGALSQALAEYGACCVLTGLSYLALAVILLAVSAGTGITLPELEGKGPAGYITVLLAMALLIPVVSALQYFLTQLVHSLAGGVLLSFCCVAGMGYLSGCFYPLSFFPPSIQKISAWMPTGLLMEYLQRILTGDGAGMIPVLLMLWILLFAGASAGVKKFRLAH